MFSIAVFVVFFNAFVAVDSEGLNSTMLGDFLLGFLVSNRNSSFLGKEEFSIFFGRSFERRLLRVLETLRFFRGDLLQIVCTSQSFFQFYNLLSRIESAYERSVGDFVARIDVLCFEYWGGHGNSSRKKHLDALFIFLG